MMFVDKPFSAALKNSDTTADLKLTYSSKHGVGDFARVLGNVPTLSRSPPALNHTPFL